MPNVVQHLRSPTAGNRPTGRDPGELYINFADGVVGYIDATGNPIDLPLGEVTVADVAPAAPRPGALWFDSVGCQLYVSYDDGSSQQWVIAVNQPAPALPPLDFLPLAGGTLTGPLEGTSADFSSAVLNGSPTETTLFVASPAGSNQYNIELDGPVTGIGTRTNGQSRWEIGFANNPETGNDTGSDFYLLSYADDGTPKTPLHIDRASGNATFSGNVTAAGSAVARGNVVADGYVYANNAAFPGFFMGGDGTNGNMAFCFNGPSANFQFQGATGDISCTSTGGVRWLSQNSDGAFMVATSLYVGWQTGNASPAVKVGINWDQPSDSSIKTNVQDYAVGLAAVLQLRPVTYEFNGQFGFTADGKPHVGLIAEELAEVFPDAVGLIKVRANPNEAELTEVKSIQFNDVNFAMLNAIKELAAQNADLAARLEALEMAR